MNKAKAILFTAAFVATGAFAMDDMKSQGMMMDMNAMDTNHDGMISKKEFMKYHEDMWAKMKKNKAGMVDIKDMEMMHGGMMKDGSTMNDGSMTKDSSMMKDGSVTKDGSMMKDGSMTKDKAGK
jgi:hypothetical protein